MTIDDYLRGRAWERDRRLPRGALLLHQHFPASPTAGRGGKRLFLRDGRVLRAAHGADFTAAVEGRVPAAWIAGVATALDALLAGPEAIELVAPPGAGVGPTCGGDHHFLLARTGLFATREILRDDEQPGGQLHDYEHDWDIGGDELRGESGQRDIDGDRGSADGDG